MRVLLFFYGTLQEVEGTPFLDLNAGPNATAVYAYGGESDGVLSFLYTVSEGEKSGDLDTSGQNAFVVPEGASITVGPTSVNSSYF